MNLKSAGASLCIAVSVTLCLLVHIVSTVWMRFLSSRVAFLFRNTNLFVHDYRTMEEMVVCVCHCIEKTATLNTGLKQECEID